MYDLKIVGARVPSSGAGLVEIGITDGRILSIDSDVGPSDEVLSADGQLVAPGLVETHLHLDKSRILDRYERPINSLQDAIRETAQLKAGFTEDDIYRRAELTLLECITHGTTTVRTHVEVDDVVGLRGFRAINQLARDYADFVELELCVFAQEGLTQSAAGQRLLKQALSEGAAVVGGAPYADRDPAGQLDLVFDYAATYDVPIDLHLDLADTTHGMRIEELCERTVAAGWQGRVTAGHVTQLSYLEPGRHAPVCDLVAASGVGITVLPATDLYLMSRDASHAKPRGVLDVRPLLDRGAACSIASNNILNGFTPFGDGSLLRIANLYANILQLAPNELDRCFALITSSASAVLGRPAGSVSEGAIADLICLPASSAGSAVARVTPPSWAMKAGRVTFRRHAPELSRLSS